MYELLGDVMKSAADLLGAYLESVRSPETAAALFADDGGIELPYLATLGWPVRTEGPAAISAFLKSLLENVPDFAFKNIRYHIVTPDQVFAEYDVVATARETGRTYKQSYAGRLVAENGKIKLLRESLDTVAAAQALFPNGLQDVAPFG
jgi:ketosteroid isomerase-like protein